MNSSEIKITSRSPTLVGRVMSSPSLSKKSGAMDEKWTVICRPGQRWSSSRLSDVAHSFTGGCRCHYSRMGSAYSDKPGYWLEQSINRHRGLVAQLRLYKDKATRRCCLVAHLTLGAQPMSSQHQLQNIVLSKCSFTNENQSINVKFSSYRTRWRI